MLKNPILKISNIQRIYHTKNESYQLELWLAESYLVLKIKAYMSNHNQWHIDENDRR